MRLKAIWGLFALLLSQFALPASPAFGANVTATGTNPAICDQTVSNATNISAYRLAGGDCVVEFKNTGNVIWTPSFSATLVRVLVVAGGGGGGAHVGSGGGAGGVIDVSNVSITQNTTISVAVGSGGTGAKLISPGCTNPDSTRITGELRTGTGSYCNDSSRATRALDGGNSSFSGSGISTLTAVGGGGGGSWNYFYPRTGGSGAGGSNSTAGPANGTTGQGNSGGAYSGNYGTGGGGGYSASGGSGSANQGGAGGAGYTTATLTGTSRSFAGGGGGGTHDAGSGGSASHGGGAGSAATTTKAASGSANTGGGGGGSGNSNAYVSEGGDGGSGIVIVRYTPDSAAPSFSNSTTFTIAENTATSSNAATITLNESSTVSINSGNDSALFTVVTSDSVTVRIRFLSSPNFESPTDVGSNNGYELSIRATDTAGNIANQSITITVTNVNEAPTITTASSAANHSITQAENISSVVTYAATDVDAGSTLSFSISGTDAADFAINSSSGVLTFATNPDFEAPIDSDTNNTYVVIITVWDGSLTDTQTLTVTITNANESASIGAPTLSGAALKGSTVTITVTSNAAGKVRFFVGGKRISNCLARSTTGSYPNFSATCSWKPPVTGSQNLTARVTPTDSSFSATTSPATSVRVIKRSNSR